MIEPVIRPFRLPAAAKPVAAPDSRQCGVWLKIELALVVFLLLVALALVLSYSAFGKAWAAKVTSAEQPQAVSRPDRATVAAIVGRGSALVGWQDPPVVWIRRLNENRTSLAEYLLRLFTSPAYLTGQAEDQDFIRDVAQVLTGTDLSMAELTGAQVLLDGLGSRTAYLTSQLVQLGLAADTVQPAQPTRLRTVTLDQDLPGEGSEIIGNVPVTLRVRLTGSAARIRLYVDGHICDELTAVQDNPALEAAYQLNWHTGREQAGAHALAVLILTEDGRGWWTDLPSYRVPHLIDVTAGTVYNRKQTIIDPAESHADWYILSQSSDAFYHFAIPLTNQPLQIQAYDAGRRLLAETACAPSEPGVLVVPDHAIAADADPVCYVRVMPAAVSSGRPSYTLVAAATWASPTDADDLLAVLARRGEQVQVRDAGGRTTWRDLTSLTVVDPVARLARLTLTGADGTPLPIVPDFSAAEQAYARYIPQDMATLRLDAVAMEGSSAHIRVILRNQRQEIRESTAQGMITIDPGISELSVAVTGFDGSMSEYTVNLLRPPDPAGFHEILDTFPLSYRNPLWALHVRRPAWQFVADRPDIDWTTFIDAQDERDRSLIDAAHAPAHWVEPGSPVYDGKSWKAASREAILYFADPRHFLDEVNLFQFEQMTYHERLHTRTGVEAILAGSFMEPGRASLDYAGIILTAGREASISPFFLAARIIQEMGRQGQSPLAFGTLPGFPGVYNFYNIGATPNPDVTNGAQINGARFALFGRNPDQGEITPDEEVWLLPWNTPERAIRGGAIWIAERYVAIGQDTLYGQKFDLIATGGLFIHQYAQNIQMAWAEGRRTWRAYSDLDLLDEPFVFRIPVFENMP